MKNSNRAFSIGAIGAIAAYAAFRGMAAHALPPSPLFDGATGAHTQTQDAVHGGAYRGDGGVSTQVGDIVGKGRLLASTGRGGPLAVKTAIKERVPAKQPNPLVDNYIDSKTPGLYFLGAIVGAAIGIGVSLTSGNPVLGWKAFLVSAAILGTLFNLLR